MSEDVHWQKYAARYKTFPASLKTIDHSAGMIVCIPVFAEPDIQSTLESLAHCDLPSVSVEVILLFNRNNRMTSAEILVHEQGWKDCNQWIFRNSKPNLYFSTIYVESMPDPKGGVGWARKLVLDEAARRLDQGDVMLCLDADCIVEKNYLRTVYEFFELHPECDAASIYFEHQLEGLDMPTRLAIVQYELHLRYLVHAMRWVGHPFSFQTVGSSMAVRRRAYLQHGGMNTRQAGEDFYFLQKFIEIDSLREIRDTVVYPSARISGRVPFGTGRAMNQLVNNSPAWMTTNLEVFLPLKQLFSSLDKLRRLALSPAAGDPYALLGSEIGLTLPLISYLRGIDFLDKCQSISGQTTALHSFTRRFFRFFNAFHMIKYSHYMRDHFYPDIPVEQAAFDLCRISGWLVESKENVEAYLRIFRQLDKNRL